MENPTSPEEILALIDVELSKRQQEISLARLSGEPIVDIARRLGIADSTARQHWHRAEKKIKQFRR